MWWRRLFRRDAMMIWLMRATEKDGDGTLDQASRRIMQSFRERSRQEEASARPREGKRSRASKRPRERYAEDQHAGRRVSL